jgi:hypothetical protein
METEKLSAVTAAVIADAAFDVTAEATRFSTQRYREIIEHVRRTGELPQAMSPVHAVHAGEQAERAPSLSLADRWRQIAKSYWTLARKYTEMSRLRREPALECHRDDAQN